MIEPAMSGDFGTLMEWADKHRRMGVRANAETPMDAETARKFGAEGIGLCRTEHMFFDPERILAVRQMIISNDESGRRTALARLLPFQREDFRQLFTIMAGLPVTIRLLDPPLHEFLPHADHEMQEVADSPGHRPRHDPPARRGTRRGQPDARPSRLPPGDRLPGNLRNAGPRDLRGRHRRRQGNRQRAPHPEIMIPLVGMKKELEITRAQVDKVAAEVFAETGTTIEYSVGTMIELPRAALLADKIAEDADFFSFGTNDLTQTVFGLSRDDAGKFLPQYVEQGFCRRTRSSRSTSRASARWSASPPKRAARPRTISSWGFAASTAAIPPRSRSASRSGWITCPAARSACRSLGWPRRRRRWAWRPTERRSTCRRVMAGRGPATHALPCWRGERRGYRARPALSVGTAIRIK